MKIVPTTFEPVKSKTFKRSQLSRNKRGRFVFTVSTIVPDPLLLWNALLAS